MAKKKTRRGRPPKPTGSARHRYVPVRMTEAEYADILKAADAAGHPVSVEIRRRLFSAPDPTIFPK